MARVSRKQVDELAELVSRQLTSGLQVRPEGRYGYIGLDLYQDGLCVRTLETGLSTGDAARYLRGMAETLDIIGRDVR